MMNVAVGFDTSCYTTSVAAVSMQGEVVAFARKLLPVEAGQRGLRQSEAVFAHIYPRYQDGRVTDGSSGDGWQMAV